MASIPLSGSQLGILPERPDLQQNLIWKIAVVLAAQVSLSGVDWVRDTAVHTGTWLGYHAVTDSVIAAVTYFQGQNPPTGNPNGLTLKAGDRIWGEIVSFQLTSGAGELIRSPGLPFS